MRPRSAGHCPLANDAFGDVSLIQFGHLDQMAAVQFQPSSFLGERGDLSRVSDLLVGPGDGSVGTHVKCEGRARSCSREGTWRVCAFAVFENGAVILLLHEAQELSPLRKGTISGFSIRVK